MIKKKDRTLLYLLFPMAILILIAASYGIYSAETYALETENWKVQAIAQDMVNMFLIVPVLLVSGILSYEGKKIGTWIFGGTLLFIIYTYAIYCFAVHFNFLFLAYCFTLGLSVYLFIYFITSTRLASKPLAAGSVAIKSVSTFLILIALIFYFLWLSEIIPSIIQKKTPASLRETGLLTNPVHVLDLSIVLPGFIIVAFLLLKGRSSGFFFAPLLLVFCVLMDISIATLVIVMKLKGLGNNLFIAGLMVVLALISSALLYIFYKGTVKRMVTK